MAERRLRLRPRRAELGLALDRTGDVPPHRDDAGLAGDLGQSRAYLHPGDGPVRPPHLDPARRRAIGQDVALQRRQRRAIGVAEHPAECGSAERLARIVAEDGACRGRDEQRVARHLVQRDHVARLLGDDPEPFLAGAQLEFGDAALGDVLDDTEQAGDGGASGPLGLAAADDVPGRAVARDDARGELEILAVRQGAVDQRGDHRAVFGMVEPDRVGKRWRRCGERYSVHPVHFFRPVQRRGADIDPPVPDPRHAAGEAEQAMALLERGERGRRLGLGGLAPSDVAHRGDELDRAMTVADELDRAFEPDQRTVGAGLAIGADLVGSAAQQRGTRLADMVPVGVRDAVQERSSGEGFGVHAEQSLGGGRDVAQHAIERDAQDHVARIVRKQAIAAFARGDRGMRRTTLGDILDRAVETGMAAVRVPHREDRGACPAHRARGIAIAQVVAHLAGRLAQWPQRREQAAAILGQGRGEHRCAEARRDVASGQRGPGRVEERPASGRIGREDHGVRAFDDAAMTGLADPHDRGEAVAMRQRRRHRQADREHRRQVELQEMDMHRDRPGGERDRSDAGQGRERADRGDRDDPGGGAGRAAPIGDDHHRRDRQEQQWEARLEEHRARGERHQPEQRRRLGRARDAARMTGPATPGEHQAERRQHQDAEQVREQPGQPEAAARAEFGKGGQRGDGRARDRGDDRDAAEPSDLGGPVEGAGTDPDPRADERAAERAGAVRDREPQAAERRGAEPQCRGERGAPAPGEQPPRRLRTQQQRRQQDRVGRPQGGEPVGLLGRGETDDRGEQIRRRDRDHADGAGGVRGGGRERARRGTLCRHGYRRINAAPPALTAPDAVARSGHGPSRR